MNRLHQVQVTATGGRTGVVASSDRRLRLNLSTRESIDKQVPGPDPEQLFGAVFAASFLSAIKIIAEQQHVTILADSNVTVTVSLRPTNPRLPCQLDIRIDADLPGVEADAAQRLIAQAQRHCPYLRAVRNNIEVRISAA